MGREMGREEDGEYQQPVLTAHSRRPVVFSRLEMKREEARERGYARDGRAGPGTAEREIGVDLKVRFHCYSESCGLPHGFCRPVRGHRPDW